MTWRDVFKPPFQLGWCGVGVCDDNEQKVLDITENEEYALKILNVLNGGEEHLPFMPFSAKGLFIIDSTRNPVIIMRGWGYLTGVGGLNLAPKQAAKIQDELQGWILKRLNGEE